LTLLHVRAIIEGDTLTDRRVLLQRRRRLPGEPYPGFWELPGGRVRPGEGLTAALRREVLEETGLEVNVIDGWRTTGDWEGSLWGPPAVGHCLRTTPDPPDLPDPPGRSDLPCVEWSIPRPVVLSRVLQGPRDLTGVAFRCRPAGDAPLQPSAPGTFRWATLEELRTLVAASAGPGDAGIDAPGLTPSDRACCAGYLRWLEVELEGRRNNDYRRLLFSILARQDAAGHRDAVRAGIAAYHEETRRSWERLAAQAQRRDLATLASTWLGFDIGYTYRVRLTDTRLECDVSSCHLADELRPRGLGDLGHAFYCAADVVRVAAFNPHIRFDRPTTLMQGDDMCRFRLSLDI